MPKLYFITGMSGSGKTTVGRRLNELGEVAFDSKIQKGLFYFSDKDGNRPSDYQPDNKAWRERYHWVLNKPMLDGLMKSNRRAKRAFLCGGSDDLMQYWPLGQKVFLLEVNVNTMIERLNRDDRDNNFGKDHQTQKRLVERIERFQKNALQMVRTRLMPRSPLMT